MQLFLQNWGILKSSSTALHQVTDWKVEPMICNSVKLAEFRDIILFLFGYRAKVSKYMLFLYLISEIRDLRIKNCPDWADTIHRNARYIRRNFADLILGIPPNSWWEPELAQVKVITEKSILFCYNLSTFREYMFTQISECNHVLIFLLLQIEVGIWLLPY